MEVVKFPGITLIYCPYILSAVQQSGENHGLYTLILVIVVIPLLFQTFLYSLPKAALALASLELTSSSMTTFLESVLPRYVNLIVHHVQALSIYRNVGFNLSLSWSW